MKIFPKFLLLSTLLLGAGSAIAVPVQWTLQDVYLADGSQVTGSFTFDADAPIDRCDYDVGVCWPTASYSDFEVQVLLSEQEGHFASGAVNFSDSGGTGGIEFLDHEYYETLITDDSALSLQCFNGCWSNESTDPLAVNFEGRLYYSLYFSFDTPLTNAGGTINLDGGIWMGVNVFGFTQLNRSSSYASGSIVASVVPLPGAVWLFGSALAGLGWLRRKQHAVN